MTLPLPPFTLVGATTRAGLLTTPLRDRFGIQHRLDHYDPAELARIVVRSARVLERGRSTPPAPARSPSARAARRASPTACSSACATSRRCAARARSTPAPPTRRWPCSGVDDTGLDRLDRELLQAICGHFGGGPVGLSTLAVTVGEEADTIEDVYEPYLLQRGFIQRTPRGRVRHAARLPPPRARRCPSPPRQLF